MKTFPSANKERVSQLFDICTPFRMDLEALAVAKRLEPNTESNKKKKKRKMEALYPFQHEVDYLRTKYSEFTQNIKEDIFPGNPSIDEIKINNKGVRDHVKEVMMIMDRDFHGTCNEEARKDNYIFPDGSQPIVCDILDFDKYLTEERKYSLILMDPPWENKHVKRVKGSGTDYKMMDNHFIQQIPVPKLLSEEGLVMIWCSNNRRHRCALESWLENWNLKQISIWYWLKLTKYGELICEFSGHKNPYEVLIIAANKKCENWKNVPDNQVLISVPSGIHSHKPSLQPVIDTVFPHLPNTRLELFARYLQPGWVSVGNEAFKLNHKTLFQE